MSANPKIGSTARAANGRDALRLWLQLITLTKTVEKKIRRNLQRDFATTLPRFDVLATLDRANKKMTMGDLTKKLLVSKGNVTGVVAFLVKQGLVRRERDEKDRRTHYLSLTANGRAEFAKLARAHKEWIDGYFSGLDAADLRIMVEHLGVLKNAINNPGNRNQA